MYNQHMTIVGKRIHTSSDEMDSSLIRAVNNYDIGVLLRWEYIEVGMEDCNIFLETDKGKYLLKAFSMVRSSEETGRVARIIEQVSKIEGLCTQRLVRDKNNESLRYLNEGKDPYVLLIWVEGEDLFSKKRKPTKHELDDLMRQAALLHSSTINPPFFLDMWAVGNIGLVYKTVEKYLNAEEKRLCSLAKDIFERIDHKSLPTGFVHGDLTKQNVIATGDGDVGIIDFSVSNVYPRIQEHAAVVANLVYTIGDDRKMILQSIEEVVASYEQYITLTRTEKEALFGYVVASFAMSALGSYKEKYISGSTLDELDFWVSQGITGLTTLLD